MAEVTLALRGRNYTINCADGQEEHIRALGEALRQRIDDALPAHAEPSENYRLVVTGILLMDALQEEQKRTAATLEAAAGRMEALAELLEKA